MYEELKNLIKHTTIYGMGSIIGKIVGFCMIPVYTRYLTPADYGTLELLELSVTLLGAILILWMNAAIMRQYYEYDDQNDRNEVITTMLAFAILIGTGVAFVAAMYAKNISQLLLKSPKYPVYIYLTSGMFFMSCINTVWWNYLRARKRSSFAVTLEIIQISTGLCLNIYLVVVRHVGVIGILSSNVIGGALIAIIVTVRSVGDLKVRVSLQKLKSIISFGYPLVFPAMAAFAVNFSDRFFLQRYNTVANVGIYSLGYKFGFMLSYLVIQPFDTIWGARMYEIGAEGEPQYLFSRIFSYYALAVVVAGLGLSLVIREVISFIAAPAFRDAYKVVPIVCLAYVFQAFQRYFLTGMYLEKKTGRFGVIGVISGVITLALNYILIPQYGIMGAAWATAISFFALTALVYVFSQRAYLIPYRLGHIGLLLVLAAAYYGLSTLVVGFALVLALTIKILLIVAFFVCLYALGWFDTGDIQQAKRILCQITGRHRNMAAAATARR